MCGFPVRGAWRVFVLMHPALHWPEDGRTVQVQGTWSHDVMKATCIEATRSPGGCIRIVIEDKGSIGPAAEEFSQ